MNNLSKLRKQKGLNQTELANAIGVAQNTISQWERGVNDIDSAKIEILCNFFEVSSDYLLGIDIARSIKGQKNKAPSEERRALVLQSELNKIGIGEPGKDLTEAELQALTEFVQNNSELIRLRAKQLQESDE